MKAVDPGFSDPLETFEVHWYSGAAAAIRGIPSSSDAKMDPGLLEIAERGRGYSGQDLLVAAQRRADLATRMSLFHEEVDVLITPTLPIPAFTSGREVPEDWAHVRWMTWTPFTYPFNLAQQPAVTVPNGLTAAGLPIGLQLVGAKYADVLVLRAAHAFEETVATDRRPPLLTCGQ